MDPVTLPQGTQKPVKATSLAKSSIKQADRKEAKKGPVRKIANANEALQTQATRIDEIGRAALDIEAKKVPPLKKEITELKKTATEAPLGQKREATKAADVQAKFEVTMRVGSMNLEAIQKRLEAIQKRLKELGETNSTIEVFEKSVLERQQETIEQAVSVKEKEMQKTALQLKQQVQEAQAKSQDAKQLVREALSKPIHEQLQAVQAGLKKKRKALEVLGERSDENANQFDRFEAEIESFTLQEKLIQELQATLKQVHATTAKAKHMDQLFALLPVGIKKFENGIDYIEESVKLMIEMERFLPTILDGDEPLFPKDELTFPEDIALNLKSAIQKLQDPAKRLSEKAKEIADLKGDLEWEKSFVGTISRLISTIFWSILGIPGFIIRSVQGAGSILVSKK